MMVGAVIHFPTVVTGKVEQRNKVDIASIRIEAPSGGGYPDKGSDDPARMFNNDSR
jgi:hypothetical protein